MYIVFASCVLYEQKKSCDLSKNIQALSLSDIRYHRHGGPEIPAMSHGNTDQNALEWKTGSALSVHCDRLASMICYTYHNNGQTVHTHVILGIFTFFCAYYGNRTLRKSFNSISPHLCLPTILLFFVCSFFKARLYSIQHFSKPCF